jgi:hypothetical protein
MNAILLVAFSNTPWEKGQTLKRILKKTCHATISKGLDVNRNKRLCKF